VPTHRHNEVVMPDGQRSGIAARVPRLRTPFARAVVPVAGGLLVMALILGATWLVAAFIAGGGAESTERLVPPVFEVGDVDRIAESVESKGPLIFPGLDTTTGERTLVLDHDGDDPTRGWVVRWAHPDDQPASCTVKQVRETREFTDCNGRRVDVTALQPGNGVTPLVENRRTLYLDLRKATGSPTSTPAGS